MAEASNPTGYNKTSIIIHWVTAISVLAMFLTHEKDYRLYHVSMGFFLGAFFLWRVLRRVKRGPTTEPAQAPLFQLGSKLVIFGMIACLTIQPLTGYLLPWTAGKAFPVLFFSIPSPLPDIHFVHGLLSRIHNLSGHLIMLLALIHFGGALKHLFIDKDGVAERMIHPAKDGK